MNLLESLNEAKERAEDALEAIKGLRFETIQSEALNYLLDGRERIKSKIAEEVVEIESKMPKSIEELEGWLINLSEFRRLGRLLASEVPNWIHTAGLCSQILDEQLIAKEITPAQYASGQKFM